MACLLRIENGIITQARPSGSAAKTPAIYVNVTDGASDFTFSASPLLGEKLNKLRMVAGDLTLLVGGRLFQGEKGARQSLTLEDISWEAHKAPKTT